MERPAGIPVNSPGAEVGGEGAGGVEGLGTMVSIVGPGEGVGSLHDPPRPTRGLLVVLGRSPTQVAPESPLPTATQQMSPCQGPHHPAPPPSSAVMWKQCSGYLQRTGATVSCMAQTETVSGIAVHIVT